MSDLLSPSELRDIQTCFVLDARGKLCPEPIKMTSKKIKELRKGEIMEVLADDEASLKDFPSWSRVTGQGYLGYLDDNTLETKNPHSSVVHRFFVQKAKGQ
ncbi:MAG: sulfurtransferase TusA family protein [Candidatus Binatia bacterium]